MLQLLHEVRGKMRGIGELEQRAFRVGVRDDRLGLNFFAGRKQHAGGNAVLYANLNDFRAGANLHAHSLCRRCHGLSNRAHAPRSK